jgi:hypothetical protein
VFLDTFVPHVHSWLKIQLFVCCYSCLSTLWPSGDTCHLTTCWCFSRQVWFIVLRGFGLQDLAPQAMEPSFEEWWESVSMRVSGQRRKGLNSIVILWAWSLWNHRNRCVFYGANPSLSAIVSVVNEELVQWSFAGARGVSFLLAQAPATT